MIWGIVASAVCIMLPVIEASDLVAAVLRGKRLASNSSAHSSTHAQAAKAHPGPGGAPAAGPDGGPGAAAAADAAAAVAVAVDGSGVEPVKSRSRQALVSAVLCVQLPTSRNARS